MESEESQGFLAYDCRSHGIADVFSEPQHAVEPSHEEPYDLIAFLATCQKLRVDFVPLRWLVALGTIGTGGEARVNQSLMNRSTDLAFRRVKLDAHSREEQIHMYRSLIFQLDILCGVGTKVHPNIIDMIAVSWEISPGIPAQCQGSSTPGDSQILPVLIFERARHGNLYRFMTEGAGKSFGSVAKIKLCLDIISGIENLHDKCVYEASHSHH